jgi:hypothetical protein
MAKGGLKFGTSLVELAELLSRETVEINTVRAYEMAEYLAWDDGVLMLKTGNQLVHIFLRIEA